MCAACEKLGEYQTCSYRNQIADNGTPCSLIVRSYKNRRYFYKAFKQQQHHRKKPGGQDIHNSGANCTSCQEESDSGSHRPKISERHPLRDAAREDVNADEMGQAEDIGGNPNIHRAAIAALSCNGGSDEVVDA